MLLQLMLVSAGLGSATAAGVTCPTLPQPPQGMQRFALTAGPYSGSAYQTLAYNGSKWGPELRVQLGELLQVDVTNAGIQVGVG